MPKKRPKPKQPLSSRKKGRKVAPLWMLNRDGLTNTAIQQFIECREQFALRYIEGWSTRKLSVPLTFGSLWHLAHEFRLTKDPWQGVTKYRSLAQLNLTPDALRELDHQIALVQTLFPVYRQHYRRADTQVKFTAHESTFAIEKVVLGEKILIRGKRDSEYKVSQRGSTKSMLGLWEIKTKSRIDQRAISNLLRCDFQTLLYMWSLKVENGVCPSQLTYDVIKRPGQRQKVGERLPAFLKRIAAEAKRKPSDYFLRWKVDVTESDINRFDKQLLTPVLEEIVRWNREVSKAPFGEERLACQHHYTNLNALTTAYGKSDLYDLMVLGRRTNYFKRQYPHPELIE